MPTPGPRTISSALLAGFVRKHSRPSPSSAQPTITNGRAVEQEAWTPRAARASTVPLHPVSGSSASPRATPQAPPPPPAPPSPAAVARPAGGAWRTRPCASPRRLHRRRRYPPKASALLVTAGLPPPRRTSGGWKGPSRRLHRSAPSATRARRARSPG
jgi:hypothetical protein